MSRQSPYLHRPSSYFHETVEEITNERFFLLTKKGSTVFVLKNTSDTTFTVVIGQSMMCSCGGGLARGKSCHHILFVVLKVLRISIDNPLAWQLSMVDSEVDQILSGAYIARNVSSSNGDGTVVPSSQSLHSFLRKGQGHGGGTTHKNKKNNENENRNGTSPSVKVERKELSNDPTCCICMDNMTEGDLEEDLLCYCEVLCGTNFHRQCFRLYATYNRSENRRRPILCPICRGESERIPSAPSTKSRKNTI